MTTQIARLDSNQKVNGDDSLERTTALGKTEGSRERWTDWLNA